MTGNAPVRGVIFDLDGTLTVPVLDFEAIRAEIGLTDRSLPILESLDRMPEAERRRGLAILERHEDEAARQSELSAGAAELLAFLSGRGIRSGIVTRNSRRSVDAFCRKHGIRFDATVTREDAPIKPSPEPLWLAVEQMGVGRHEVIYVGDFEMDRLTGEAANIPTYIVQHYAKPRDNGPAAMRIAGLMEIARIIGGGGS